MRGMRQIDVRIQLELIDEDPFNAEWIEQAVEDVMFLDQGERIIKFETSSPSCPVVDNNPNTVSQQMQDELEPIIHPTQHDESDELEAVKYTTTITPYDDIPDSVKFMDRFPKRLKI